jgi:Cu/Ag efflux protein CusF
MRKLLVLISIFGLVALAAGVASAQNKLPDLVPDFVSTAPATGQPKVLKENIKTVTATVESIDLKTRAVTLRGPEGKVMGVKAGEEVKNLPQVKVGDKVVATYYESIAARIVKPGTGQASAAQQAVATAKPGEKPAGAMVQQVTVTATVEAIDRNSQHVTLKGQEGKTVDVKVQDPKNLEGVKVGDEVVITYTEALAISVEKA